MSVAASTGWITRPSVNYGAPEIVDWARSQDLARSCVECPSLFDERPAIVGGQIHESAAKRTGDHVIIEQPFDRLRAEFAAIRAGDFKHPIPDLGHDVLLFCILGSPFTEILV